MAKKFITTKELTMINNINRELIQNWISQDVYYYAISPEESEINDTYGEAIRKVWAPPVQINGLVNFNDSTTRSTSEGSDQVYDMEVYCHTQELIERNLKPIVGDFVEFGQVFFEISSVTLPQLVFGQANNKIMTKLTCVTAREGQFSAGSSIEEFVDRSHPVQPRLPKTLGGQ